MSRIYAIQCRIPEKTAWEQEGSGDRYESREAAEAALETLEDSNDDGEPLEYRVVCTLAAGVSS